MIQVIEHPNPAIEQEIGAFLTWSQLAGSGEEHDPRWLHVLGRAFGHRLYMLVARNSSGDICGYLPVALVAGRLFGRFLVSLPYLNRGGVLATRSDVKAAIIDQAVVLAGELDVQFLELRHVDPVAHPSLPEGRDEKFQMMLDLPSDAEILWQSIGAKVRNQIRKADKLDLACRWGGRELVDDFYTVFAINMRDLGTPVFPKKLFVQIVERFAEEAELVVVDLKGSAVAAAMLIHTPSVTQVPSASSLRRYNKTNANMWMYHQLLLRAIERGRRRFDFGRSSQNSGTYHFKKQWGAYPIPTMWQYHVRRGDINTARPENPRYRRRIAVWQRMPVWVTRLIGPTIVKWIP